MNFELYPRKIFNTHVALILLLMCANTLGIISKQYFDHDYVYGLVPLFDFNSEHNIPTIFSSITLVACSALLYIIAINNKKINSSYIHWGALSLIFLFLSIDELICIHEKLIDPVRDALGTSGYLYFAWVIPYGVLLFFFIVAYSRFLLNLPKKIMVLFLASGAIFVSGAIGFEMFGGKHLEIFGENNIFNPFYYTCEEFLEMLGIALFLFTLLTHIVDKFESLTIRVTYFNRPPIL